MMCTTVVKYCMIHLLLSFLCFDLQIAVQSAASAGITKNSTVGNSTTSTDSTTNSTVGNSTTSTDSTTNSTVGNSTTSTDSTTNSTVGNSTTSTDSTTNSTVGNSTTSTDSTTNSTVGNSTTSTDSTTTSTVGNSTTSTESTTTSTVGNSTASTESTTTSTIQRSTSKKKPTPTTHVPTPPPRRKLILEKVNIPVPLKLKFNVNFTNYLKNKQSEEYKEKEAEYTEKLTSVYNETEGFKEIRINQFMRGSLVVDFEVLYDLQTSNKTDLERDLKGVEMKIRTLPAIDSDYINDQYDDIVNNAITEVEKYQKNPCEIPDVCESDYTCIKDKTDYVCEHKCSQHTSKCSNRGYCVLNTEHQPICLCPKKGDVIYGGEFCEETAEQLAMSKRDIIITASVGGGGLILILSLTIVYLCRKKKGKRAPKPVQVEGDDSEKSFKSMRNSQDGLHQSYSAKNNYTNYNNPTFRHFGGSLDQLSRDPYDVRTTQHSSWHTRDLSNGLELTPRGPTDQVDMRGPGRPSDPNAPEIERSPDYGPYHANTSRTPDGPRPPALSSQVSNNYVEIDDYKSKAIMYRPTSIKQPLPGIQQIDHPLRPDDAPKVYDYYNHRQSAMSQSSRPSNRSSRVMSGDFDDDITVQHYAISRPRVSSQRRF